MQSKPKHAPCLRMFWLRQSWHLEFRCRVWRGGIFPNQNGAWGHFMLQFLRMLVLKYVNWIIIELGQLKTTVSHLVVSSCIHYIGGPVTSGVQTAPFHLYLIWCRLATVCSLVKQISPDFVSITSENMWNDGVSYVTSSFKSVWVTLYAPESCHSEICAGGIMFWVFHD